MPAAPWLFGAFVAAHLVIVFGVLTLVFPWTMQQQWSAGPLAIVLTSLGFSLLFCFGEFFFHRYLLHMETAKLVRKLCTSHLAHHKLTPVGFDADGKVKSGYAIEDEAHDLSATFPPWALVAFGAFWTPFFAAGAFSFPRFPVLIGGYSALAMAHFLYETIHVAHHMPYDPWWKRKIERGIFAPLWRRLYGFHQAHHVNYKCNMNVAGFYGVPLADLVLGTYKQPPTLLLDGVPSSKAVARDLTPEPRWPISWLDEVALKRRKRISKEP